MDDPHDDTDVPSGTTDGAQMERTSPPVLRRESIIASASQDFGRSMCPKTHSSAEQ
jgi:hypothetical protein